MDVIEDKPIDKVHEKVYCELDILIERNLYTQLHNEFNKDYPFNDLYDELRDELNV